MRPAVLVIDMIVDFTTGRYGSAAARAIRPAVARLLSCARRARIPVIYGQDSHSPDDPELKVWGRHGLFGTPGAQTDPALRPKGGEPVVPKHVFSAFFRTHLEEVLKERQVDTLVLAGVATEICVQHTAADAFYRGYKLMVPKDGTAGLSPGGHEQGLGAMAKVYGAKIVDVAYLLRRFSK
jgi:nicotinamidase-related amidase